MVKHSEDISQIIAPIPTTSASITSEQMITILTNKLNETIHAVNVLLLDTKALRGK